TMQWQGSETNNEAGSGRVHVVVEAVARRDPRIGTLTPLISRRSRPVGCSSMNRILVIGGTGNVGRQVVCQLAATGARFRAMTRNPDAAGLPPQVEVVRGDLTVPETLDRCLQDID